MFIEFCRLPVSGILESCSEDVRTAVSFLYFDIQFPDLLFTNEFLNMVHTFIHNPHSWAAQWMSNGLHRHRWTWNRSQQSGVEARDGMWTHFWTELAQEWGTTAPSESHLWENNSSSQQILSSLRFGLKLWFAFQQNTADQRISYILLLREREHLLGPLSFCWHPDSNLETNNTECTLSLKCCRSLV